MNYNEASGEPRRANIDFLLKSQIPRGNSADTQSINYACISELIEPTTGFDCPTSNGFTIGRGFALGFLPEDQSMGFTYDQAMLDINRLRRSYPSGSDVIAYVILPSNSCNILVVSTQSLKSPRDHRIHVGRGGIGHTFSIENGRRQIGVFWNSSTLEGIEKMATEVLQVPFARGLQRLQG